MAKRSNVARAGVSNDRVKRTYLSYLKEARGRAVTSVDHAASAIARFESHTGGCSFRQFTPAQAISFKDELFSTRNPRTGAPLSKATLRTILSDLRAFFQWLSKQPSFKAKLQYDDADYFNMSDKDKRIANTPRQKRVPTLEQVQQVLRALPSNTVIEKRDRAIIAFALLTGARAAAIVSARLKHVDLEVRHFYQDARDVRTKFSKTISTWFFPVGSLAEEIVVEWINLLRHDLGFRNDDPLFPCTSINGGPQQKFQVDGVNHRHWASTDGLRKCFKAAFAQAGLPYSNPHIMRDVLSRRGQQVCRTAEELNAWATNLGHNDVLTTLHSYGHVPDYRRQEIFDAFRSGPPPAPPSSDDLVQEFTAFLAARRAGSKAGSS